MSTIKLSNINKFFGKDTARVHVLRDLNFTAEKGELVLILGPSGSGKSTFLTIAGGLQSADSGKVKINNENVSNLSPKQRDSLRLNQIGFILQAYNLVPYLTVKEQFTFVDKIKKNDNLSEKELSSLLDTLEISALKNKYPDQLSGGQKQRVAIARALYANPEIILADEPTAALDSEKVKEVGMLLAKLAHEQNKTIIVVTHDIRLDSFADKVYHLDDGILRQHE